MDEGSKDRIGTRSFGEEVMKHVIVELSGKVSIDGQSRPGGEYHFRVFEDDEWVGGGYATKNDLGDKIVEAFEE